MDPNSSLALTDKGVDELKHRTCKLSIRKRSVLLLLEKPHSIEELLGRSVLQPDEFKVEIENLMRDGFVRMGSANAAPAPVASATPAAKPTPPQYSNDPFAALATMLPSSTPAAAAQPKAPLSASGDLQLHEDIVLSEAKYLLVDFSVDSFGTRSQVFADEIGACRSVEALMTCLQKVHTETQNRCPERLPALTAVVKAINDTA